MLRFHDLLPPECVCRAVQAHSRKRTLDIAADLLAERHPGIEARQLFDALMERERLGSTGIGEGVAIPHCRLSSPAPASASASASAPAMMAAFFSLAKAVDYDAPDDKPVDLVFVLVVPVEETTAHLEALSILASVFRNPATRSRLRQAASAGELRQYFLEAAGRWP